jgi:ribose-phosphate pyrophosphokinase
MEKDRIKLFGLNASIELAQEISKETKIPLSKCSLTRFEDGEIHLNIEESVRGYHVFVIQSTYTPVNEHLMELLVMCDALKRASAKTINLFIPYYGYSRQDRKSQPRQPITAKLVATLLEVSGASRVASFDFHASQIQGFFDIPTDNFQGVPILADYFIKKLGKENIVVVSPDHGGTTRARNFASFFGSPLAIMDKRRPTPNEVESLNIIGDVKGRVAIMIDDMIDTGRTVIASAAHLLKEGALEVYVAATHGVFSNDSIERIEKSLIKQVVVTNTIPLKTKSKKIVQVTVGKLLGKAIIRQINDEPISILFNEIDA